MLQHKIIIELFEEMTEANRKAKEASLQYNRLVEEIEISEQKSGERRGMTRSIIQQNIRTRTDTDFELKSLYNRYTFWAGEVQRISALFKAIESYKSLRGSTT